MSRRQSPVTAVHDDASSSMSALLWPARSVGSGGALLACALRRADRAGQELLLRTGGAADLDAHTAARVQGVLEECGARQAVEDLIQERHHQALERLNRAHLPVTAAFALRDLIQAVHNRTA
jgi:geranylgeranyl diphosphate synthase type I